MREAGGPSNCMLARAPQRESIASVEVKRRRTTATKEAEIRCSKVDAKNKFRGIRRAERGSFRTCEDLEFPLGPMSNQQPRQLGCCSKLQSILILILIILIIFTLDITLYYIILYLHRC